MRSYIRLDPNLPATKAAYSDGQWRAYVEVLCHSEWQPVRGTFQSERLLRVILGRRARHIPHLLAHRDLIRNADGSLYVAGWAEWNEGDYTAAERMRRYRSRKGVTAAVTPGVTPPVTAPLRNPSAERVTPPGVEVGIEVEGTRRNGPTVTPAQTFMGFRPGEHRGQHGSDCLVCHPLEPGQDLPPPKRPEGERQRLADLIRASVPAMRPRLVATYERHYGPWTETESASEPGGTGKPTGPDAREES